MKKSMEQAAQNTKNPRRQSTEGSIESSGIDLTKYQYQEISSYSKADIRQRSSGFNGLKVVLPTKKSNELVSMESLRQIPAKQAILQKSKAKRENKMSFNQINEKLKPQAIHKKAEFREGPRDNLIDEFPKTKQGSINGKGKMFRSIEIIRESRKKISESFHGKKEQSKVDYSENFKKSKDDVKSKSQIAKENIAQSDQKSKENSEDGINDKPRSSAPRRWGALRAVHHVGGLYSEVHKRHRYISMKAVLKQIKKQNKLLPKIPIELEKSSRARRFTITVRPDPRISRQLKQKSRHSVENLSEYPMSAIASEPSVSSANQRISFMVSSHEKPNVSAAVTKSKKFSRRICRSNNIVIDTSTKNSSTSVIRTPIPMLNPTKSIHGVHKLTNITKSVEQKRAKGGFDFAIKGDDESDPPIRISEAIAAILQEFEEDDVLLMFSPVREDSVHDPSFLKITVIVWNQSQVLGSFLIPTNHAMSTDEERVFAQFFCVSATQDFENYNKDLTSILKYLSKFKHASLKSISFSKTKSTEQLLQQCSLVDANNACLSNPNEVFYNAKKNEMKIYIRPNFFGKDMTTFSCDFFSVYGKYVASHDFGADDILKQMIKYPEFMSKFEIVVDAVEVVFPRECFQKNFLRGLEHLMKRLGFINVYDYFCHVLFSIFKKLF